MTVLDANRHLQNLKTLNVGKLQGQRTTRYHQGYYNYSNWMSELQATGTSEHNSNAVKLLGSEAYLLCGSRYGRYPGASAWGSQTSEGHLRQPWGLETIALLLCDCKIKTEDKNFTKTTIYFHPHSQSSLRRNAYLSEGNLQQPWGLETIAWLLCDCQI